KYFIYKKRLCVPLPLQGMFRKAFSLLFRHQSCPRHHYFRRILCSFFGKMIEKGEMTSNEKYVGEVVKDICYRNAISYLNVK
ncbi:MAG: glucuronate isomerase, partial [Clostridia bacterium]|nr:glucuronate isomerase [Clostridia bacterium]